MVFVAVVVVVVVNNVGEADVVFIVVGVGSSQVKVDSKRKHLQQLRLK